MCLDWLRNKICRNENISPPSFLDVIEYQELLSILNAEFPEATILLSDNKYKTTTKEELMRFLREDNTDKYQYISEWFDCDNFSYSLMGNLSSPNWGCIPFGILWVKISTGSHAVNCFVDSDREVWIIEPQNDSIFRLETKPTWKPYLIII